jgi:phage/plasmid-like protein (TIGR03299 family)
MGLVPDKFADGTAAFATLRTPAWHTLGEVFTTEKSTPEMLTAARLDNWNTRLEELTFPTGYTFDTPALAVVRDHPFDKHPDVLSIVGGRYKVVQNEELFGFADNILAEHDGVRWETAGAMKGGKVVFGSLALDREFVLDPSGVSDKVNMYLLVHTSHDGSTAVQASVTPVRVVCQNTLNMAIKSAKQTYKIRHTQTVEGKIAAAREALGIAYNYVEAFEAEAQALYATPVSKAKWNEIVAAVYPMPEKDAKGSLKKWETKVDLLDEIYAGATNGMIAGTAWGAYNAFGERLDWYRKSRGGNPENIAAAASGFDPVTNADKNRILSIVKTLAGVGA